MAGYTRQSSFVDGDTITAAIFNDEFNQLLNAFDNSTGHKHDGTTAEGPVIALIGDSGSSPINKVLIDTSNSHIEFWIDVSSTSVQQMYIADGAILPVTDNDIDLGSASLEFKDLYLDGTATIDILTVDESATIGTTLGVTGATTLSSTLGVTGATTLSSTLAVTGASTLTGNVTASNDVSVGGNLTVTGNTTISGNLTLGDADTDSITLGAEFASDLIPDVDGTYDIGSALKEWQDLYIDGTANIDSLVADTADIDGGTIDGAVIGGSSAAAITGTTVTFSDLSDGTITVTAFVDEDDMTSDSATLIPTQQSVKAYVDAQVTAQDLDFQGDSGGALSIDLDSESLTIAGGTGIDTTGALNTLTVAIDSTVATLTDAQTLTNKTIDVDSNTVSNIEVDNFKASAIVLEAEGISSSDNDTSLPTSAAVKDYVDSQVTAQDLDFQADTGGALNIDLDSETLILTGGTGVDTAGSGNTVTFSLDLNELTTETAIAQDDFVAMVDNTDSGSGKITFSDLEDAVFGNVSGDATVAAGGALTLANSGVTAASYGSTTAIPVITVDAKGRLTAVSTAAISTILDIAADSGTDDGVAIGTDTLTISGTADEIETSVSGDTITIGLPSDVTVGNNLTVTGDLTVNGTTVTVNSSTVTVDDPIFTIGGDTAPASDDNKDRGIEFRWHDGVSAKVGFFGYDDSASVFTFIPDATNTSEVFSGSVGNVAFGNIAGTLTTAAQTNITSVGTLSALTVTGEITANGGIALGDSDKATFGDSDDLEIFHDGGNSVISDTGTGDLVLKGSSAIRLRNQTPVEMLVAKDGDSVDIYFNGDKKLATTSTGIDVTGNIVVSGTVDGRDVATDGTKLDGIESGATADQTAAEIRTLVDSASDSNVFTDADHSKLDGIESGATADQTAAEIRTLVESATDSNVFTDADHTKLNGIEAGATADQTITAGTGLSGGGTGDFTLDVSGLTTSEFAAGSILTSAESFVDSDTQVMTAAAINDRIQSFGYTTNTGTVTSVSGGTGLTGTVTTSGSISLATAGIGAGTYGSTADGTKIDTITVDAYGRVTAVATGSTGDINAVTAGNGLTNGGTSGSVTLNVGAGTGIDVAADTVSVDVSDFMSNGSNNRVLTATGTDAMNAEANLTFDGSSLNVTGTLYADDQVTVSGAGGTSIDMIVTDATYAKIRQAASSADVLELQSFGDVHVNLDYNNNSTAKNFDVRHNGESGAGTLLFRVSDSGNHSVVGNLDISGNLNNVTDIYVDDQILHSGDTDTYLQFHAANQFRVVTGGTEMFEVNDTEAMFTNCNLNMNSNYIHNISDLYVEDQIFHEDDTNTYMQFHAADQWRVVTGGTERLEANNTNVTVNNANLIVNPVDVAADKVALDVAASLSGGMLNIDLENTNGTGQARASFRAINNSGDQVEYGIAGSGHSSIARHAFIWSSAPNGLEIQANTYIAGTLSKASGSFNIRHPNPDLKDTHRLIHGFVESPDADNLYRGTVELVDGTATVNLDTLARMTEGTWVALNTDPVVFTTNETGWDATKGSVSGNILTINCQNATSTDTISFLVIARRQDDHVIHHESFDDDGRLIVERIATDDERNEPSAELRKKFVYNSAGEVIYPKPGWDLNGDPVPLDDWRLEDYWTPPVEEQSNEPVDNGGGE